MPAKGAAGTPYIVERYREATLECVLRSAIQRNVPADVLLAIGQREAGKEGSAIRNKNGTYDFGRAGINDIRIEDLSRRFGMNKDVVRYYLTYDGCYNYDMAAFFLSEHLRDCRTEFWTCAANYHSKTPSKNAVYRKHLIKLSADWRKYLQTAFQVKDYSK